jgi:hypothetical protein
MHEKLWAIHVGPRHIVVAPQPGPCPTPACAALLVPLRLVPSSAGPPQAGMGHHGAQKPGAQRFDNAGMAVLCSDFEPMLLSP